MDRNFCLQLSTSILTDTSIERNIETSKCRYSRWIIFGYLNNYQIQMKKNRLAKVAQLDA